MTKTVRWLGNIPEKCETCSTPITDTFYDAKTSYPNGPWACMCHTCQTLGPGLNRLGTGWGQKYVKQPSGKFIKTEG